MSLVITNDYINIKYIIGITFLIKDKKYRFKFVYFNHVWNRQVNNEIIDGDRESKSIIIIIDIIF